VFVAIQITWTKKLNNALHYATPQELMPAWVEAANRVQSMANTEFTWVDIPSETRAYYDPNGFIAVFNDVPKEVFEELQLDVVRMKCYLLAKPDPERHNCTIHLGHSGGHNSRRCKSLYGVTVPQFMDYTKDPWSQALFVAASRVIGRYIASRISVDFYNDQQRIEMFLGRIALGNIVDDITCHLLSSCRLGPRHVLGPHVDDKNDPSPQGSPVVTMAQYDYLGEQDAVDRTGITTYWKKDVSDAQRKLQLVKPVIDAVTDYLENRAHPDLIKLDTSLLVPPGQEPVSLDGCSIYKFPVYAGPFLHQIEQVMRKYTLADRARSFPGMAFSMLAVGHAPAHFWHTMEDLLENPNLINDCHIESQEPDVFAYGLYRYLFELTNENTYYHSELRHQPTHNTMATDLECIESIDTLQRLHMEFSAASEEDLEFNLESYYNVTAAILCMNSHGRAADDSSNNFVAGVFGCGELSAQLLIMVCAGSGYWYEGLLGHAEVPIGTFNHDAWGFDRSDHHQQTQELLKCMKTVFESECIMEEEKLCHLGKDSRGVSHVKKDMIFPAVPWYEYSSANRYVTVLGMLGVKKRYTTSSVSSLTSDEEVVQGAQGKNFWSFSYGRTARTKTPRKSKPSATQYLPAMFPNVKLINGRNEVEHVTQLSKALPCPTAHQVIMTDPTATGPGPFRCEIDPVRMVRYSVGGHNNTPDKVVFYEKQLRFYGPLQKPVGVQPRRYATNRERKRAYKHHKGTQKKTETETCCWIDYCQELQQVEKTLSDDFKLPRHDVAGKHCFQFGIKTGVSDDSMVYFPRADFALYRSQLESTQVDGSILASSFVHQANNGRFFVGRQEAKEYVCLSYLLSNKGRCSFTEDLKNLLVIDHDKGEEDVLRPGRELRQPRHLRDLPQHIFRSRVYYSNFRVFSFSQNKSFGHAPSLVGVRYKRGGYGYYLTDSNGARCSDIHLSRPLSLASRSRGSAGPLLPTLFVGIEGHDGPLASSHPDYQGCKYNFKVRWTDDSVTPVGVTTLSAQAYAECYQYAELHGLLHKVGFGHLRNRKIRPTVPLPVAVELIGNLRNTTNKRAGKTPKKTKKGQFTGECQEDSEEYPKPIN